MLETHVDILEHKEIYPVFGTACTPPFRRYLRYLGTHNALAEVPHVCNLPNLNIMILVTNII